MNTRKFLRFLSTMFLLMLVPACGSAASKPPAWPASYASESIADTIASFQEEIPQHMQQDKIPGLAIAVVDDQGILWEEGFGYTDWDRRIPVTPSTIFSIQSMSKSFTATAAMFAAQEGLVDLDAPITTYLPNFTVHSVFEDHPEQKMTLRILLSHTAGFPHDVAYGSNTDNSPFSVEKHNASISDTQLMFPVGTRYSYSNIGIDLAGYILSVRSGMPFIQYVQQKVLDPLGMKDSTLDYQRVRATPTRAIGHSESPFRPPVNLQLIPSGGVWASAEDMARYVQFHMNKGALDGTRLLREDMAETMYTPPNVPANRYALGIQVDPVHGTRQLQHGGGGFGFNSQMVWYPELKLGVVVLINSHTPDQYAYSLGEKVLDSIITNDSVTYFRRGQSAVQIEPAYLPSREDNVLTDSRLKTLIESKALPEDASAQQRRSAAVGTYIINDWGFPSDTIEISESNGKLAGIYHGGLSQYSHTITLTEVEPGLYLSENGDPFDLRGPAPMVSNIRLVKAIPQSLPFKIALYAFCGLMFLSALFFWPVRVLTSRIRRKKAPAAGPAAGSLPSPWLAWTNILAVVASLFSLFCLAAEALVPNLVYFPWPLPFVDLAWWQFALVGLPYASLVLAVGVALLAVLALRRSTWARSTRWYYLAVGLALLVFNGMILLFPYALLERR